MLNKLTNSWIDDESTAMSKTPCIVMEWIILFSL